MLVLRAAGVCRMRVVVAVCMHTMAAIVLTRDCAACLSGCAADGLHAHLGLQYPIYATQFHPEKNAFEWASFLRIPHSEAAIEVGQETANFFVSQARRSRHAAVSVCVLCVCVLCASCWQQ